MFVFAWVALTAIVLHVRSLFGQERRRAAYVWLGAWLALWAVVFVVVPELARDGALPGSRALSICEESPGSGCAECEASAALQGVSAEGCHEGAVADWAQTVAQLSPMRAPPPAERPRAELPTTE